LYLSNRPMTEIYFSPAEMPTHYRRFDRAERVYFDAEEMDDEKRAMNLERTYELAMQHVPAEQPVRVPFDHAAFVAQTVPQDAWEDEGVATLQETGHVPDDIGEDDLERVLQRLKHAQRWADMYAPEQYIYDFNDSVPEDVVQQLSSDQIAAMHALADLLESEEYSDTAELEDDLFDLSRDADVDVGEFFAAAYQCLLSRADGPRLADFILTRGQDEVLNVLTTLD
ncbi:MAG: hypothetical protein ABEI97_01440, partial [Candidatus Nanohaloarchaea archaeon]